MNIEDIEIGETYNIQVKVEKTIPEFNSVIFTINGGDNGYAFGIQDRTIKEILSPLPTPPKYDPTRLFKEGDKVRYCERDGRKLFRLQDGAIYEVKSNEGDAGTVEIWLWKEVGRYESYPYNVFELVTPVEKMGPYKVERKPGHYIVYYQDQDKDGMTGQMYLQAVFFFGHPKKYTEDEALAAAEAECERLNDEWRKEQGK